MNQPRCARCGLPAPAGARFCPDCGNRLDVSAPSSPSHPSGGGAIPPGIGADPILPMQEGTLIGDRYELRGMLGKGGMGAVMAAWDRLVREEVAIKFMHPFFLQGEEGVKRFLREGRLARRLNHPNIVRTMNIESHQGLTCIVMERLRGRTLREVIRDRGLPLPVPFVLALGDQVLAALEAAHANGVIHRDIKPQNVWIETEDPVRVKVMDFGLAKDVLPGDGDVTMVPKLLGTPSYMAPEQGRLGGAVDHRADLHSLAVVVHELLTGALPGSELGLGVPEPLRPVLAKALAADPDQRYPTAAEMRRAWRAATRAAGVPEALRTVAAPSDRAEAPTEVSPDPDVPRASSSGATLARAASDAGASAGADAAARSGALRARIGLALAAVAVLALVAWAVIEKAGGGGGVPAPPPTTSTTLATPATSDAPGPSGPVAATAPAAEDAESTPLDPVPIGATWEELGAWLEAHPTHPERAQAEVMRADLEARARAQHDAATAALAGGDVAAAQAAVAAGRALWPQMPGWAELAERVDAEADWARIAEEPSLPAIRRFLESHPASARAADARARIAALEAEEARDPAVRELNDIVATRSLERLSEFAAKAPPKIAQRARRELASLATEQAEAAMERAAAAAVAGDLAAAEAARAEVVEAAKLGNLTLDLGPIDADVEALRAYEAARRDGGATAWRQFLARPDSTRVPSRAAEARREVAQSAASEVRRRLEALAPGATLPPADAEQLQALIEEGRRGDPQAADWRALATSVREAAIAQPSLEAVREAAEKGDLPLALREARRYAATRPADREAMLWVAALRWQAGGEQAPALEDLRELASGNDRTATAARVLVRELSPPGFRPVVGSGCWACGYPARYEAYQCPHCLWVLPRIVRIEAGEGRSTDVIRWQGARIAGSTTEGKVGPRLLPRAERRGGDEVLRAVHDFMYEDGLLRRVATRGEAGRDERIVRTTMRGSPWRTVDPVDVLLGRNVKAVRLGNLANLTPYLPWAEMSSFEPQHDERDRLTSLRDVQTGVIYQVDLDADGRLLGLRASDGSLSRRLSWRDGRLRSEDLRVTWDGSVTSRTVTHETSDDGRVRKTSVDLPGANLVVTYE